MALLTITSAAPVRVIEQITGPVGEAITKGQYVRLNPTTGKIELGNGTTTAEAKRGGIALESVVAGQSVTAIVSGLVDVGEGLVGLNFGVDVFLSDTDGTLADAAGTVSRIVGRVWPAWGATTADRILKVELGG